MAYFGQTSNLLILLCVCVFLEENVAISGMKRAAMGWEAEHLPMGSSSSGFVFRLLFCLLCWSGDQMKVGEGCVYVQAVLYCCSTGSLCREFLLCVQECSKWRGGKPVDLFGVTDNALPLLILCSCMGLSTLSLCFAVVEFLLPSG